jgi:hypothetical protein
MKKFNKRQRVAENIAYTFLLCICLALLLVTLSSSSTDIGYINSPVVFGSVNDISIAIISMIMASIIAYKLVRDLVIPMVKNSSADRRIENKKVCNPKVVKHFNLLILIYIIFYLWYLLYSFDSSYLLKFKLFDIEFYQWSNRYELFYLSNTFLSAASMVSAFFMLYFNRAALYLFTFIFLYWIGITIFDEPVIINSIDAVFGYIVGYSSAVILYLSWFSEIKTLFEKYE